MIRILAFYLFVGLAGAFVMYHIAKAKGVKPMPWAIFGALTGPAVLFLIFWMQKQEQRKRD